MLSHFKQLDQQPRPSGDALPAPAWERLTAREAEVLANVSKGFTIKEVARQMNTHWFAVNDHIRSVYGKLAASTGGLPTVTAEDDQPV